MRSSAASISCGDITMSTPDSRADVSLPGAGRSHGFGSTLRERTITAPEQDPAAEPLSPRTSEQRTGHTAAIGSAITVYAILDAYTLGLAAFLLAAFTNALVVFVVVLAIQLVINLAAGSWIDRTWDVWIAAGIGQRFESKLDKVRTGRTGSRVVALISGGSDLAFAIAAALANAVVVIGLARVMAGKPLGRQRVVAAAVGYSVFFAGLFAFMGWIFRDFLVANL